MSDPCVPDPQVPCQKSFLFTARAPQCDPTGAWHTWLFMGGRGSGKTRAGAEWVRRLVLFGGYRRIALVGPTFNDVREVMIEGFSGLRSIMRAGERAPEYEVSRHRLVWPNGAEAHAFSAEDPDGLRGPQFDAAWCDEVAAWQNGRAVWDMLQMTLRLGPNPRIIATTTPRRVPLVRALVEGATVAVTRSATRDNAENLSPVFLDHVERLYGNSDLGRQELAGELLDEESGALWTRALIDLVSLTHHPGPLTEIVVAVDPPAGVGAAADACGIVAAGTRRDAGGLVSGYVLADAQLPDPLIEAIEGAGQTPAYRGTAYIVFEDLPLDAFGNRLPQLSFEVVRAGSDETGLRKLAEGVNVIPASGEFVYGTRIVRERFFPGTEKPLNMNNASGEADFRSSLDQLTSDLPGTNSATLTVGWFGDDVRAGHCRIRPGVETRNRSTAPYQWGVAGEIRTSAYLVSQSGGSANYGGTPTDVAVKEGIAAMQAEGMAVTLSPFLLMDVPSDNGLPDPYGGDEQAAFPWRGRIVASEDGTAAVRTEIDAFLGTDHDFGYRHFILHHAGGVEAILIGSEMRGLTRLRDETGAFPFVEGLVQLAADVKAIVGPGVKVSYAADWTEYGAYTPDDGSNDILFPLDVLWASADIDFVGVDWYPPAGDWRDGDTHLDRLAGYTAADDPAYLADQMAGGEAYDWYYASQAHRDSQIRTPITDTAHGEHWVFRQKDLAGWWNAAHHERPGGAREATPTDWVPGMKPVRLIEIGFPAVDKGGNAPNLFYDPKSSESALPPYSSGERDDVLQRRALEAALAYWQAQPCVEKTFIWAWDARPWPDFPVRESVWSDGPNWSYGHWLNGRTGLIEVGEAVSDFGARAGIDLDGSRLSGWLEGIALTGPMPLRRALEPLRAAHGLSCVEREGGLICTDQASVDTVQVNAARLAESGLSLTYNLLDKRPGRLQLSFISADGTYAPAAVDARSDLGDPTQTIEAALPLVLSDAEASDLAARLLESALQPDAAGFVLPPEYLHLEPGDRVEMDGLASAWQVTDIIDDGLTRHCSAVRPMEGQGLRASALPDEAPVAPRPAVPKLVLVDGPPFGPGQQTGPLAAVAALPWPGPVDVRAGTSVSQARRRATVNGPAGFGRLAAPLSAGPLGRWDRAGAIVLEIAGEDLSSAEPADVLAGANRLLVRNATGWELIGFETAELIAENQWRLGGLLRGLNGSPVITVDAGAICLLADERLVSAGLLPQEVALPLIWQAGPGDPQTFSHTDVAGLGWSVAHLSASPGESGPVITWLPRGLDIPDNWDLPDPVRQRQYLVEALAGGEVARSQYETVRVAEIGTDGRIGQRVSIPLGAS